MVRQRIRLHFSKKDHLSFIGHRDLLRLMERLFRRARLPLTMSQGFHPKPRISYFSALPLGFSGLDEVMEILLDEMMEPQVLQETLLPLCPDGLTFTQVEASDEKKGEKAASFEYQIDFPQLYLDSVERKSRELHLLPSMIVTKVNGKEVDLRPPLLALQLLRSGNDQSMPSLALWGTPIEIIGDSRTDSATLICRIAVQQGPEAGVRELLDYLGIKTELFRTIFPVRTRTNLESE